MDKLLSAMGATEKQRDKYVLIFDEFHEAFKSGKDGTCLGSIMKPMLDAGGPNSLPHVIAITTKKDHEQYIRPVDAAIDRRFNFFYIESYSREDTLDNLELTLAREAPAA